LSGSLPQYRLRMFQVFYLTLPVTPYVKKGGGLDAPQAALRREKNYLLFGFDALRCLNRQEHRSPILHPLGSSKLIPRNRALRHRISQLVGSSLLARLNHGRSWVAASYTKPMQLTSQTRFQSPRAGGAQAQYSSSTSCGGNHYAMYTIQVDLSRNDAIDILLASRSFLPALE
jgi:hypothetical protein